MAAADGTATGSAFFTANGSGTPAVQPQMPDPSGTPAEVTPQRMLEGIPQHMEERLVEHPVHQGPYPKKS